MKTLAVLGMLHRAGAVKPEMAVPAKELMAFRIDDEKAYDLDAISSRLSDLYKRRPDLVGRNEAEYVEGSGTRYKYFVKRDPKLTATGRMKNRKRKHAGNGAVKETGYRVQIEGPGLVFDREVDGERAFAMLRQFIAETK